MVAFQSRSGGCCCGLLDLGEGSEVLVQPLRSGSFLNGPGLLRYRRPKTTVPGWRERLLCCKCGSREVDIVVTGIERAAGLFGRSPIVHWRYRFTGGGEWIRTSSSAPDRQRLR